MKNLQDEAKRKGWTLMQHTDVQGDGMQAPGAITLCSMKDTSAGGKEVTQYFVHFFNSQTGGFSNGGYHDNPRTAAEDYVKMAKRWTRHHEAPVTTAKQVRDAV